MTTQTTFFDITAKRKVQRANVIFSLDFDEKKIIQAIMALYLDGRPFDCDPTYSKGVFWRGLPEPRYKFDLYPQTADTKQASSNRLPFNNGELTSIMFDPPFVVKNTQRENGQLGEIEKRFFGYPTLADLHAHYTESLIEFYRVLRHGGIVAFKCQDTITGGHNYPIHVEVINMARAEGFIFEDIFILGNKNVMLAPNLANQQHAKKNHSYFIVFTKETL